MPQIEFDGFDELVDAALLKLADQIERRLRERESQGLPTRSMDEKAIAGDLLSDVVAQVVAERSERGLGLPTPAEEMAVRETVLAEMFGLGRLQPLLADPEVEDIDIIGSERAVVTYADGRVARAHPVASSDEGLIRFVQRVAARNGRTERMFNSAQPMLRMALKPGGERLTATMEVTDRPQVSIRRHRHPEVHLDQQPGSSAPGLYELGMLSHAQVALLRSAMQARKNIAVVGEQGAGKTTLGRALCWEVAAAERFATVETEYELGLHRYPERFPRVVPFEERPPNTERENGRPVGGISLSAQVQHALRMNTRRLIVGEVRGPEVFPMLEALSTGADGSLFTLHARSASDAIERLVGLCMQPERGWTPEFAYRMISQSIDLIVHVEIDTTDGRRDRYVDEIVAISRGEEGRPAETALFRPPVARGNGAHGGRRGVPTGHLPVDIEDYERVRFSRAWLTGGGDGRWVLGETTRKAAAYV